MVTSVNVPPVAEGAPPAVPPKGRKFCACGCKGTLDAESTRHYIRGHRPGAAKKIRAQAAATRLPNLLKELRGEIEWRELRHREMEKAIGLNLQKLRTLREVVEKMETIQEREPGPDPAEA